MRLLPARGGDGGGRRTPAATRRAARVLEEQALTALYAEHAAALRTFVRKHQPDPHRAEDCVQETFARAWHHIDRIRADGNPRAYLFTTARNVLTDEWRAQERRPRLVHDERALAAEPSVESVDAALEAMSIGEAVARLAPEHRGVVQALYFDGLSVAEAAVRLQIPVGTVKSRSYYAVRALRAHLSEMGLL